MAVEVTLYSKERCVQCTASERKLGAESVEYTHANAVESIDYIQSLDKAYMQAPVMTVAVDGEVVDHWTGYRPDKIEALKATYGLV